MNYRYLICVVILFLLNIFCIYSESTIILDEQQGKYPLGKNLEYYIDDIGALDVERLIGNSKEFDFTPSDMQNLNFGFTKDIIWVKFQIQNPTAVNQDLILEYAHPHMDLVKVYYIPDKGERLEFYGGDLFPYSHRQINYKNLLFKINLPSGGNADVYLRFETKGSMQIPLTLWKHITFIERVNKEQFLFGLYFGILIALMLYNLFLFTTLKDKTYLYYILYMLFFILVQLEISRFDMEYLWPNATGFANISFPLFYNIAFFFAALFSRTFLSTPKNSPLIDKFILLMMSVAVTGILLTLFVGYNAGFLPVLYILAIIEPIVLLSAGIVCLKRGIINARYFVIAWSLLITGSFIFNLRNITLLPSIFITDYILYFGSALEALFLSLALADRIKIIEKEKIAAQEIAFNTQKNFLEDLEIQVKERTAQLETSNRKLEKLSNIDGLTGLSNRRHFDNRLAEECSRQNRNDIPLSFILCDIDYFKKYNDTYGHAAGDSCLIQIAKVLNRSINREIDVAARYGGEEFAIILPNVDEEGAMVVAERILDKVRDLKIPHESSSVSNSVSISMGVTTVHGNNRVVPLDIITSSDSALYESKKNGRNRITVNNIV